MSPGPTPEQAAYAIWTAWLISWMAAALWSGATVKRPTLSGLSIYRIPEVLGFVLLFGLAAQGRHPDIERFGRYPLPAHLWQFPTIVGWLMAGSCAVGFVFAWWARLHLGRLWSGTITRKENHRVVDTGPYALVRHPIYTGILFAAAALTVLEGTSAAIAGTLLLLVGFWLKARLEERFLRNELGRDAYDAYARRTPMLIPFL